MAKNIIKTMIEIANIAKKTKVEENLEVNASTTPLQIARAAALE